MSIDRNISSLHPKMQGPVRSLADDLAHAYQSGRTKTLFKFFEGFRSPSRQEELFEAKTTKARAWQSAHNFGLAADFVAYGPNGWTWITDDWEFLLNRAKLVGLVNPIFDWDKPHLEHPGWKWVQTVMRHDTNWLEKIKS